MKRVAAVDLGASSGRVMAGTAGPSRLAVEEVHPEIPGREDGLPPTGAPSEQGPDAGEFLNRLYCNGWSTLEIGKARYGLMLREDGIVFDDGTTSRLADDHFFMTTTTANAARVMSHMEFCHQALWPDLDVQYVSVTEQWAQMAVAGPKARATLQKIIEILGTRHPKSVKICALLQKRIPGNDDVPIDYLGFPIEDVFVVGYGLDHAEAFRNLPYIAVLEPDGDGSQAPA